MHLCSMSTSLPSDLSSRGRQGSTVSDNTTGVTPIVDNVQLSLPAPSPVCDAIEDDESNDGASSVDEDLDEYYLVNEVSPAAADAQDAINVICASPYTNGLKRTHTRSKLPSREWCSNGQRQQKRPLTAVQV